MMTTAVLVVAAIVFLGTAFVLTAAETGLTYLPRADAEAISRDVDELRTNGFAGSSDEIVDKIGRFTEVGTTRFYLQVLDLGDLDHIEEFAATVVPQLP